MAPRAVTQITRQAANRPCNIAVSNFMAVLRGWVDEVFDWMAQASMEPMVVTQISRQAAKKPCNMMVSNFMVVLRLGFGW
jgi:hypothetical protein